MTSTNLPTRLLIPVPFASKSGAAFTAIADGSSTTEGTVVNFQDGFPSIYATAGSSGKYVGRGDMNALGDLASRNQFLRMCGGLVEFDSEFCTKIGGYPAGAVLDWLDGSYLYRVLSLVDNNTYDFVTNGVDGTNWKILNQNDASTDPITLMEQTSFGELNAIDPTFLGTTICCAKLPRSGSVSPTFLFGTRTVSSESEAAKSFQILMTYKIPTSSEYDNVVLATDSSSESFTITPIELPAGTIITIVLTMSNIKYSSFSAKVVLI